MYGGSVRMKLTLAAGSWGRTVRQSPLMMVLWCMALPSLLVSCLGESAADMLADEENQRIGVAFFVG